MNMQEIKENIPNCPNCGRHCPIDAVSCPRGEEFVKKLLSGELSPEDGAKVGSGEGKHGHGEEHEHCGEDHGHHGPHGHYGKHPHGHGGWHGHHEHEGENEENDAAE